MENHLKETGEAPAKILQIEKIFKIEGAFKYGAEGEGGSVGIIKKLSIGEVFL